MSTDTAQLATQAGAGTRKKPRREETWEGWTAEQDQMLRQWVREHGRRWVGLAQASVMEGRTSDALRLRWHRLASGEVATAPLASASTSA